MADIKIKMLKTVKAMSFFEGACSHVAKKGHKYNADSNNYGAIFAKIDGKQLGVKPDEFEFIEAPAWVLEKHGRLSEKYEGLTVEVEKLKHQNEKLKEMLTRTNIYDSVFVKDDTCIFCGNRPHTKDCEYVRLCGEGGEDV